MDMSLGSQFSISLLPDYSHGLGIRYTYENGAISVVPPVLLLSLSDYWF